MRELPAVLADAGRTAAAQVLEVALVLPVLTATAGDLLRRRTCAASSISCGGPTQARALVVLVHGFGASPGSWSAVADALAEHDVLVARFAYRHSGTTLARLGSELRASVAALADDRGARTVHLVGHSLGGLVIGEALTDQLFARRVGTVVTLGSPLSGSPWADTLPVPALLRCVRAGSSELRRLAELLPQVGVRWLSIGFSGDVLVPPQCTALPTLTESVLVDGVGHCSLLRDREVVAQVVAAVLATASSYARSAA